MSITLIIFLITTISNGLLLALVIFKKYKHLTNPSYATFVLGIFFLILWTLFNFLADTSSVYSHALFYTHATLPPSLLMVWSIFVFSSLFPTSLGRPKIITWIYFGFVILFSALSFTKFVIVSIAIDPAIGISHVENTWLFIPIVLLFLSMYCHSIMLLVKKFRILKGTSREQVRYVLIGWGFFAIGSMVVSAVLPLMSNPDWSKLGPFFSMGIVGFVTYAILKHQFLDIRIIIQRGLIYLVLLAMLGGIYIIGLQILASLLHQLANITIITTAGVTMVIGIVLFNPFEHFLRKITDPCFFKDPYHYAIALHTLSEVLYENVSQGAIVTASTELLKSIFKTSRAEFRLSDYAAISSSVFETACSTPIVFGDRPVGIIELGPKRSGDAYTDNDKQLLTTFACQAAIALEKGRLYEKVQEYSAHLEQLVTDRTSEIKQLQEDQKQAMMDISHNLQTPLTVIKRELETLAPKGMQSVRRSLERISEFIRQLLHLAKLDHKAFDVVFINFNLSKAIQEQIDYFETMTHEQNITLTTSLDSNIFITGNKKLIDELLMNLVTNSIKYRRKIISSIITISLQRAESGIHLNIEDNGMGITPEDLPQIFNPFYRGHHKGIFPGTGLGLAICKKIVEKHDGSISMKSELNKGTKTLIKFPQK